MRLRQTAAGIAACLAMAGCVCGTDLSQARFKCLTDLDCIDGFSCVQNVCVIDAGVPADAGADGGGTRDSGSPGDCCTDPTACAPSQLIANEAAQPAPGAIAVDPSFVYWTGGFAIRRARHDGTGTGTLVTGGAPGTRITLDSTQVYWQGAFAGGTDGGVFRALLDGGGLATVQFPLNFQAGIEVSGMNLYWIADNGFWATPTQLSAPPVESFAFQVGSVRDLVVDATAAYWGSYAVVLSDGGTGYGRLTKTVLGSGTFSVLVPGQNVDELALDATSVYWLNTPPGAGQFGPYGLFRIAKDGDGGVQSVASFPGGKPRSIVVDANAAYWTVEDAVGGHGTLMTQPLDGGAPGCLASGLAHPFRLTQDAQTLYWTDDGADTVTSVPKP